MRNLLLLSTMVILPAAASAELPISLNTHTYTLIELSSISSLPKTGVKLASVCFMGFGACDPNIGFGKGNDYTIDTEKQCLNEGFIKLNCSSVQVIDGVCPYNPAYGKACKCSPSLVACAAVQTGVGAACGGKYASCKCPSGVTNLPYGCQEYYASPCNSVCKTAYTDNCRNRSSVSAPYGCATYWSDCPSKCQSGYADNCRNRTPASCSYGCLSNWNDCASKCQDCYNDNCRNRSSITIPANATCASPYYDCTSKCSTWTCNAGYVQSGNSCIPESCPSGYDISVKSCNFGYTLKTNGTAKGQACGKCEITPCPAGSYVGYCGSGETHDGAVGYSGNQSCIICRPETCDEASWPHKGVTNPSSCGRGRYWVETLRYRGSGLCGTCADSPCPDGSDVDRLNFLCGPGYTKTIVGYTGDRACYKCIR